MLDITNFVFKHNGQILRVAATNKQTYKVDRNVVSRVGAACEFVIEHNGRRYAITASAVLALTEIDVSQGHVATTMEQRHVVIHKNIPADVLKFEEVEYSITYTHKHNPPTPTTSKDKK